MDRSRKDPNYQNCAFINVSVGNNTGDCSSQSDAKETEDMSRAKGNDHSQDPKPSTSKGDSNANEVNAAIEKERQQQQKDDEMAMAKGAKPASCVNVNVARPMSFDFSHVIVYMAPTKLRDGSMSISKGIFKVFDFADLALEHPLTDFEMEKGMYTNAWGTRVKPVRVKFADDTYVEASLFCRIRIAAQMELVIAMAGRLTRQLEVYKDDLRDGIAQEWCAQEQWRIFPRFPAMMHEIKRIGDGRPDLREILKELLPDGFDNEWPL